MIRKLLSGIATAALVLGMTAHADAAVTIKMGTLAPQDSPWGREFKKWAKDVEKDSGGELLLDFQWNGVAGDELLMVQKVRSGQLDGAAITAVGLGQIYKDVLVFQLPGIFPNWAKLDAARDAMKDKLNDEFDKAGFTIVGWGDVGALKSMSVGFEVHHPVDIQGKGTFYLPGDPIEPAIFAKIGNITPKSMTVPEILPALTSGAVTLLVAPPLVAEQLQWASRVTHINSMTVAYGIGAVVVSSAKMRAIDPKLRDIFIGRGRESQERLTKSIRNLDAAALDRMKASKQAYTPSPAEKAEWVAIFDAVRADLTGPVFSADLVKRVMQLAK